MEFLQQLFHFSKKIAASGVRETHDSEARRKIYLLNTFFYTGITCLFILGIVAFYQNAHLLGLVDLTIATALLLLLFYLRFSGNQTFCSYVTASLIIVFYCFLFVSGGVSGTAFMWLYTYPIVSLFLLGLFHGTVATFFLFFFTFIVLALDIFFQAINLYDFSFAIRFIPSFLIIFGFTYFIEKSRADAHIALVKKQDALTLVVVRLKNKEKQLKHAQDKLEHRVAERTNELLEANKHLQEEIEDRKKAEEERNRLQSELSRAQKMEVLGRLAGGVAHDLNNVLSGIVSYPDFLLLDLPEESHLRSPLETIKNSGERAAAIVQDLLTLARRGVTVKKPLSLNQTLKEYFSSPEYTQLRELHPNITVESKMDEDIPLLNGSPLHLQKALMNLVGNAFEAVEGAGHIAISTKSKHLSSPYKGYEVIKEGLYVILEIQDSGAGMPPEVLSKIFEPFYTKKKMGRSGTGLGMTVVWGAVKDHEGYIDIKSDPGHGTTIYTYLPASLENNISRQDEIPKGQEANQGTGQSILIVDDVQEQRDIGTSIMKKLGYQAEAVSSGEEAVKRIKRHHFDLILLDMIMSTGMDGLETFRAILTICPHQKVIIVSGYSENNRVREAMSLGNGAYLKKPYTIKEVSSIVANELSSTPDIPNGN